MKKHKIKCDRCKDKKYWNSFPAGLFGTLGTGGWPKGFKMVCMSCRKEVVLETDTQQEIKDKYEKMCSTREREKKELQKSLWDELAEQLGDDFDIDADSTPFTESEECDGMMERYQNDMIEVLSGLEDKLPEWYGLEVEEEE